MTDPRPSQPANDPPATPIVPTFDVRNCIVCGKPMQARSCKYRCRDCGTMIDCSDAY